MMLVVKSFPVSIAPSREPWSKPQQFAEINAVLYHTPNVKHIDRV